MITISEFNIAKPNGHVNTESATNFLNRSACFVNKFLIGLSDMFYFYRVKMWYIKYKKLSCAQLRAMLDYELRSINTKQKGE